MTETKLQFYSDISEYAEIIAQIFLSTYGLSRSKDARVIKTLCGHPHSFGLVARTDKSSDGFILLQQAGDSADVIEFCVRSSAQKKGIGRRLLENALRAARSHGIERVMLEVASTNQSALRLYQTSGFETIGQRPGYYRSDSRTIDALVMCCEVSGLVLSSSPVTKA